MVDEAWGWNASAPLYSVEPEFYRQAEDELKKELLLLDEKVARLVDDTHALIQPMEDVQVNINKKIIAVRLIKYDPKTKKATVSYNNFYRTIPLDAFITPTYLIDPAENLKAKEHAAATLLSKLTPDLKEKSRLNILAVDTAARHTNERNRHIYYKDKWYGAADLVEYIMSE